MDTFIFYGDYIRQIQADNLQQIIGNNTILLDGLQRAAEQECKSYLKQKFDVTRAFRAISQHDPSKAYKAGDTVYLSAPAYSATSTYAIGNRVLQDSKVYSCSTIISSQEAFTIAHWTLLGNQYDLYYAILPKLEFDYTVVYAVGDQVFWKDKTYTCKLATQILGHQELLESQSATTNPIVNTFPDDITNGVKYWGSGTAYSVPVNALISDITKWSPGDARDQKLVMTCVDIALFNAHARIAPRNIPELRVQRYMGIHEDRVVVAGKVIYPTYSALGWLQACADGAITPDMQVIQPKSGGRIRYGGNAKLNNTY